MKIIEPSFKLSTIYSDEMISEDGIVMLQFIEKQARISHRSEDKQTIDSWQKFIPAVVIQHGDWSVTEHCSVTATIRTDRGITHELVRHRLFSFTQESTRFVNGVKNYPNGLEFILPEGLEPDITGSFDTWKFAMQEAENRYNEMIDNRIRPQEARSVLPNALAATISVTGNLRAWRWLFLARTTRETHPDFRRIADPMLKEFKRVVPILFDDIEPDARQIDNARKAH